MIERRPKPVNKMNAAPVRVGVRYHITDAYRGFAAEPVALKRNKAGYHRNIAGLHDGPAGFIAQKARKQSAGVNPYPWLPLPWPDHFVPCVKVLSPAVIHLVEAFIRSRISG